MIFAGRDHPVETARRGSTCARRRSDVRRGRCFARHWSRDGEPHFAPASRDELTRTSASRRWQRVADPRSRRRAARCDRCRDTRRDGRRARGDAHATLRHHHESIRRHARACAARLLSKKKSFVATERDTPENLKRREEFRALLNGGSGSAPRCAARCAQGALDPRARCRPACERRRTVLS